MSVTSAAVLDWSAPWSALEVGLAFETPERVVTEADVHAFAALTGDHHPQHVDPAWAAGSAFGGQIAHGLLVLSCAAGLVPFDPDRVVALRRVTDVVFKRPVALGETISVSGSVKELKSFGPEAPGLVACRWRVHGAEGKTVLLATVEVLWR